MTNLGFWQKLPKPFFVLAPMADVTDCVFRRIIAKYSKYDGMDIYDNEGKFKNPNILKKDLGGPDVFWTEFVSADGLIRATEEGKQKLMKDLEYSEAERPIVAQLFGSHPEYMEKAAALCQALGFDGIDINMGCPDKSIEKQGAGASMIKNPALAVEIIQSAQRGAPKLPISVKTRIGYNKVEIEEWLPILLKEKLAALTIHARTRKEMSKVPARWEYVKRAVEIRDEQKVNTLIIGNGDVLDLDDARKKVFETGCDGVMLGRAIFGNPWLFSSRSRLKSAERRDLEVRLKVLVEHTKLFEELLGRNAKSVGQTGTLEPVIGGIKNFAVMKKHFKSYVKNFFVPLSGMDGVGELKEELMKTENAEGVRKVCENFLLKLT